MSTEIDVLCASHGNEPLGLVVHEMAPEGVRTRIAHPEAAAQDKRHLGPLQIMDCYPGNLSGNPEEIAAAQNMLWLGSRAGSENVAVYDVHNNNHPGLHFFEMGSRALQATVVGAYTLGYSICIVRPDSFYESVPNAAVLETPILSEAEYHPAAEKKSCAEVWVK